MASTVYYGTSITGENVPQKVVKIKQADFNPNNLRPGDILSVYFAHRNSVENPSLVYTIGDSEQEISATGSDNGDSIKNTNQNGALPGAWTDGEVVNFSYTADSDITQGSNNTTYWEMVAKGIATDETYGVVKIDDGDESAISVGAVKDMLESLTAPTVIYHSLFEDGEKIGTIEVTYYHIDGTSETVETDVKIPPIPTNISYFNNDVGYITNLITTDITFNGADSDGSKKIQIDDGDGAITIIDLDNYNNGVDIYSQENINLLPTGQVVIGTQGDNKNLTVYGDIYGNTLDLSGIPAEQTGLLTDWIGAHTDDGIITFTSPTNLEDDITMNGGIYIGNQTLEDYVESLFDSDENKDVIGDAAAGLLSDYLKTVRYHAGPTSIGLNSIKTVVYGDNPTAIPSDTIPSTVITGKNLNIEGYEILGVITWETYMNGTSNPKNANIYGIWWQGNDPKSGVLYLKLTALDAAANNIKTSVDILYKKKTYTITYDANGGSGAPKAQYKFHNRKITLSKVVPTRTGYTFDGWSATGDDVAARKFSPGNTYTLNSSAVLKAIWK